MLSNNNQLVNRSTRRVNSIIWKRGKLCFTITFFQTIIAILLTLFSVYEESAEPSDRRYSSVDGFYQMSNPIERYLPNLRDHMILSLLGLGLSSTSSSATLLASLGFNLLTFTFASSWALLWPHLITSSWESVKSEGQSRGNLTFSSSPSSSLSASSSSSSFSSSSSPFSSSSSSIPVNSTVYVISSPSHDLQVKSNLSCDDYLSDLDRKKIKPTVKLSIRQSFHITLGINSILRSAHYGLGVTLSLGSLQGKLSPIQCIILAVIEVPIMSLTGYVLSSWQVSDESNGLTIYTFSIYFGLSVSCIICRNIQSTHRKNQNYNSDREMSVLLGTIFIYLTFPSMTSSYSLGDKKHRLAVNTWISVTASCLSAFSISSLLDEQDRFSVRHIRIGSSSGGVLMSIIGQYILYPYTAFISGMMIGGLSIITHIYLNPYLLNRFRIHDTLSMHATYGLPAVIAGLASSGFAYMANEKSYDLNLYELFPARAPPENSKDLEEIQVNLHRIQAGIGRSAHSQAFYQLTGLIFILLISIITGLIAGIILIQPVFDPPDKIDLFQDGLYWVLSSEHEDTFQSVYENEPNSEEMNNERNRR
ncbi:ammonium transporter Rh type B-like [Panonychus citri]|uniref:ammonium transporter Rh type B-like n=1 Tax=Panonychus citri TaxID=50023 RepID=UPI002307CED7|nr:ammonium transporter Rh type B-like [Panonychus citri]